MTRCLLIFFILFAISNKTWSQQSANASVCVKLNTVQGLHVSKKPVTEDDAIAQPDQYQLSVVSVGKSVVRVSKAVMHTGNIFQASRKQKGNKSIPKSSHILSSGQDQNLTTMVDIDLNAYENMLHIGGTNDGQPVLMYTIEAF